MIKTKVVFTSYLKMKIGLSEVDMLIEEGSSVYDLAKQVGERFGEEVNNYLFTKGNGLVKVAFICNKINCTKDQILNEGDIVTIFPQITGG